MLRRSITTARPNDGAASDADGVGAAGPGAAGNGVVSTAADGDSTAAAGAAGDVAVGAVDTGGDRGDPSTGLAGDEGVWRVKLAKMPIWPSRVRAS
jgi:hypothetical protein